MISEPLTTARDAKRELIPQIGNTPLIELVELCSVDQSKDVLFAVFHLINEVLTFFSPVFDLPFFYHLLISPHFFFLFKKNNNRS